jgi:hypothetical protein
MKLEHHIVVERLRNLIETDRIDIVRLLCKHDGIAATFIEEVPELPWDFGMLSYNPSVTPAFVRRHLDAAWDWKILSRRGGEFLAADDLCNKCPPRRVDASVISCELVLPYLDPWYAIHHPDLDWDWRHITMRGHISVEFILEHRDRAPWDLTVLTSKRCKTLTMDIIVGNPDIPWDFHVLCAREDVFCNIEDVLRHPGLPWDWVRLSQNPSIANEDALERHPDLPWDYDSLSWNENVSLDYVRAHPDKPWNMDVAVSLKEKSTERQLRFWMTQAMPWTWDMLSGSTYVTLPLVLQHRSLPWNWTTLSHNLLITIDEIIQTPNLPWNWDVVSARADIDENVVDAHPELPWNWHMLSSSTCVTLDFIERHADKPLNWMVIALKKCIDLAFYERFKDRLPSATFIACYNPGVFLRVSAGVYEKEARRHMAAWRIQRWWLQQYYHPQARVCRQRLKRSFDELQSDTLGHEFRKRV